MGAVPGTPTAPLTGATALRKVVWSAKKNVITVRPSVFTAIKAEYDLIGSELVINKPGIMLDVTNEGVKGQGQSVRLALRNPLKKRAFYGDEVVLGNEDESSLLWAEVFYNEINKPVKMYERGYQANDVAWLQYNQSYDGLTNLFIQEMDDYFHHQALILTYAENLTFAPVSKVAALNKNWFVPNVPEASQPAWDTTALTVTDGSADSDSYYSSRDYRGAPSMVENLTAAIVAGSGTGSTPNNTMTVTAWARMRNYILNNHILDPIMLDGKVTYVCLVPITVMSWMLNNANTGSLGSYFQAVAFYKSNERDIIPGEFGRVMDCFLLIEDHRSVTLTVSGSSGSYVLTPGYVQPGNNDDRNNAAWSNASGSTNYVHDVMIVMGANALAKYTRDELQTGLTQMTEYQKIKGVNAYKGEGVQIPFFDLDAASQTDTSRVYRGSLCVPVGRVAA